MPRVLRLAGHLTPLASELDQNLLIETPSQERFVLKIAKRTRRTVALMPTNAAMRHMASTGITPPSDPCSVGRVVCVTGTGHAVRLLTWYRASRLDRSRVARSSPGDLGAPTRSDQRGAVVIRPSRAAPALSLGPRRRCADHRRLRSLDRDETLRGLVCGLSVHMASRDGKRYGACAGRVIMGRERLQRPCRLTARRAACLGLIDFGDMVHSYTPSPSLR